PAYAEPHPPKGPDPLLRVTLSTGEFFTATSGHRVMLDDGSWSSVGALSPGARLLSGQPLLQSAPVPLESMPARVPSTREQDARSSTRTAPGSRGDCLSGLRSCGERPLQDGD